MTLPSQSAVSCRLSCHRSRSLSLIRRKVRLTRFRDGLRPTLNLPRLVAEARHAKEVERLRLALPPFPTVRLREPAEPDEPGLVRMQFQSVSGQSFPQVIQEVLRFPLMLKANDEVIRMADGDCVASRSPLAPCVMEPDVEDMVQADVGADRGNGSLNAKGNFCLQ